ncbi:MAG: hypothetical protein MAGBODY4_01769 [Candidatus Marinimicrobia bacterium]|nr:hypothetical protein [Candidatus Neomarinimicrobiota bacterium]
MHPRADIFGNKVYTGKCILANRFRNDFRFFHTENFRNVEPLTLNPVHPHSDSGDNPVKKNLYVFAMITILAGTTLTMYGKDDQSMNDADLRTQAEQLAEELIILDSHIDAPYQLTKEYVDWTQPSDRHFDYPKAVKGGLDAPFMSIYISPKYQDGGAKMQADELIGMVQKQVNAHPDKFAIPLSPSDVRKHVTAGKMSVAMGMENGAPIEGDLANLQYFFDWGIRYITLTHAKDNHICDSSYDTTYTWDGLSPFGKKLIPAMNNIGMMIDISHVTDSTAFQVLELSKAPVVATHSGCRKFTPGFHRNMSDTLIKALAKRDGIVQINFGSYFVSDSYRQHRGDRSENIRAYLDEHGLERSDPEAKSYIEEYDQEHPLADADISDVVQHIDHVVQLVGIDHVGLGSDYDGVGSVPTGLEDVSKYPNLIYELLKEGYSESDIRKICSGNFLRVWEEVEHVANDPESG